MGGYVSFEILRRAPERVERLALIDTQATPDSPDIDRAPAWPGRTDHIGRFHGVQPSMLPHIVHRSHLDDPAITQPILDMAREIGAEGFLREQHGDHRPRPTAGRCWSISRCPPW